MGREPNTYTVFGGILWQAVKLMSLLSFDEPFDASFDEPFDVVVRQMSRLTCLT